MVGQRGRRQITGRSGRIALGHPLVVLPAERRERDDARVEPHVADLEDPRDRFAALRAADRDAVDPRPAQLLELLEPLGGEVLQLGLRPDDVQVAAGARIEGQRQSVVPPTRDVPVAHVVQPVVHALAHVLGHPRHLGVLLEQRRTDLLDGDEPVVRETKDQRRVAPPTVRVGVRVEPGLDEEAGLAEPADDLVRGLGGRQPVQPAVRVVEAARLVDRRQHRQVVDLRQLEVLAAAARRDVDDARALVHRHVVPRDHPMLDRGARSQVIERAAVAPPDQLTALECLDVRVVGEQLDRDPFSVLAPSVVLVGMHRRGDIRRQRPGRGRPDDDVLTVAVEERKADEERRVGAILVDARLRELVLGERRAAARAPLRRAVAHVEPAALVDDLQELPDVFDVRIAEGVVVVAPVHPLAETDGAARQRLRRPDDDLPAAAREFLDAELLDLTLRVQPERALDPDLDPEPLAVEAVLVALVEPAQALVALEDVLQRPAPGRVDAERGSVRRHRPVDERPARVSAVPVAQLFEGPFLLPQLQDPQLERRDDRVCPEAARTCFDRSFREQTFPGRR